MKILVELTYYRPHTSGLTIYAERMAKALVQRGHQVTILTSRYDKKLPLEEFLDGVRIIRVPVLFRISKGVIMPKIGWLANQLIRSHDVVHLHLPQFDAAGFAIRGRLLKKPTVITYHCDLKMPNGLLSWAANQTVNFMNHLACLFTHRIVTYTQDYADHSALLKKFKKKIAIIDPPVVTPEISADEAEAFRKRILAGQKKYPIIGMAARFATEKGVEVLSSAMKRVIQVYPDAMIWFAGPYENILGEQGYFNRLIPDIRKLEESGNWQFLGLLSPREMSAFYRNIDMLVIPSLNSTEAFGLVQIEAMFHDVPSIASDLPGVRQPVLRHQLGEIIPIGDASALENSVINVIENVKKFPYSAQQLKSQYSPERAALRYEALFQEIEKEIFNKSTSKKEPQQ